MLLMIISKSDEKFMGWRFTICISIYFIYFFFKKCISSIISP